MAKIYGICRKFVSGDIWFPLWFFHKLLYFSSPFSGPTIFSVYANFFLSNLGTTHIFMENSHLPNFQPSDFKIFSVIGSLFCGF